MDPVPATTSSPGPPSPELSLDDLRRVNQACEQFEADWRAGRAPRVEDSLSGWDDPCRSALLRELLALELELRRGSGEAPDPRAFLGRFPGHEAVVAAVFSEGLTATWNGRVRTSGETTVVVPARVPTGDTSGRAELPKDFGGYELLGEIARGGMGVVFKARQYRPNRVVALKMILSGRFASEAERQRFLLEAELAANLDHENIVPIYEVGEHQGRHYFSMKYIDGGNLSKEVPRLLADPRAAARLLATVARAVHHAHRRGFVHCDLKPSNILMDADGKPHVTDFGLARRVEGESGLSVSGAVMGTPSYMAPEQASGTRREVTAAADIYGLGAILYELLTGRPPFRAATLMETVVQVLEREPAPPGQLRAGVPPVLESICLKCLEKSPKDRYATAAELADNLEQYLRGETVAGTTLGRHLRRWTRREPELVSHLGGLGLIAAITQYNYFISPAPRHLTHYRVQFALAMWAVASLLFQVFLRRGCRTALASYAWAATDVIALTCVLTILDAFDSNLVVGYPLLIAASGLWFRVPLVWFTTALAFLAYAWLDVEAISRGPLSHSKQFPNIFLAALLVTGFVVARQVKRMWALSVYYENR